MLSCFIQAWERNGSTHCMMECGVWMCALLALGLYLNTLPAEFAYDDRLVYIACYFQRLGGHGSGSEL